MLSQVKMHTRTRSALHFMAAAALFVGAMNTSLAAQVYKCAVDGKVAYQTTPCPSDAPRQRPTVEQLNKERRERQQSQPAATSPAPIASPATPVSAGVSPAPAASQFRCDGRKHCTQMSSCAEAKYFLRNCPDVQMDGDNDGIPCEQQWCH